MGIRNRFVYVTGRAAAGACLALGIWWSCAMTSFADEAIKSVTIAVTSSVEMGSSGSVSATADSTKYHVVSCEFINGKTSWKAGEIPRISIELAAEEEYYFGSISSSSAHIRGRSMCRPRKAMQSAASPSLPN
ncbi:MAG: hypothetical protein LUK37_27095 [Clostridia bacterium]|nr:hypothetical protein [Clostridia bacterium]